MDVKLLSVNEIGGKASNLKRLEDLNIRVPKWTVIPAAVLTQQLNADQPFAEQMHQLNLPDADHDNLKNFFGEDKLKTYAVRSSAIDEDSKLNSFAGLFETHLHVPFQEIEEYIKKVWASTAAERVQVYRKGNQLPEHNSIAVIVQEMIDADVAGVAFGLDPVSGNRATKVISAVYGLGEGLVSGELDADTFHVADEIQAKVVRKERALQLSSIQKGVEWKVVPENKQNQATLNKEQLREISQLLDQLNKELGGPQDIEFAYKDNTLYLLQTRPITAIAGDGKGEYTVWDNSNIIESYPGITTPLTYTFIVKMYEAVYRQLVSLLGVRQKEIEERKDVFANTLGLIRGRVYYNLLSWYKMLAMLPGYSLNAEHMETMMGVKERFELKEDYRMTKGMARLRILFMVFRMLWLQLRLPRERKRFMRFLNTVMAEYEAKNFDQMEPKELIQCYREYERKLLLEWKAPMINDFFAMIWFGVLKKKTSALLPDEPNLHNDLLCGSQDIISVEPVHLSLEIARLVAEDEVCKSFFLANEPQIIYSALQQGDFPQVKTAIDNYLHRFGNRCVGELKLETISYKEEPSLFVQVIKTYVQQNITRMKIDKRRDEDLRKSAEAKITSALKGKGLKRWWFNFILKKAREHVSSRENLRYERTRGFGMVRLMFAALGRKLASQGLLEDAHDIFYLELDEVLKMDHPKDWKPLVEQRKHEFYDYRNQEDPQERFYTYGNDFSDAYIYSKEKLEPIKGDLQGIGCCPGRVKAKVRIVKDPKEIDSLNGDILVTSSTDPGWVTLFPTASAIIVERGSLLSHSAIVSREMGIPCIVGVTGLLRSLESGDEVEMDGSTGEIKVLKHG